jgi:hypothetical protein
VDRAIPDLLGELELEHAQGALPREFRRAATPERHTTSRRHYQHAELLGLPQRYPPPGLGEAGAVEAPPGEAQR